MKNPSLKIILIGDGRVGKTSIINKYVNNLFDENEESSTSCCFFDKAYMHEGKKYKICIWDTAGQEKFNSITPIYYRDAKGIIIVYDITRKSTFDRVKKWLEEIKNYNENAYIVVVGNKIDIKKEDKDFVDKNQSISYLSKLNYKLFFTSAKTGEGVEEVFNNVAQNVIGKYLKEHNDDDNKITFNKHNKKILITKTNNEENENNQNQNWCC